jgi:type IV fimbrial biogenesis protein FimT
MEGVTSMDTYNAFVRESQSGFTLSELMIALAIGTILTTMAVPALSKILESERLTTRIYEFVAHLNYAREIAIFRNQRVTLCKSADGLICDNNLEWEDGWIIFIDGDNNHKRTADEAIIRSQSSIRATTNIRYSANLGHNNYVSFTPVGTSFGNGTFTFCAGRSDTVPRALILARTGKVRISREKPDGTALTCPD